MSVTRRITGSTSSAALHPQAAHPSAPAGSSRTRHVLSIPHTLSWSTALGLGAGALLLRSKGAGFGMAALASGAWKGAAAGAGAGAALVATDHATAGEVKRQIDFLAVDRRAQVGFVLLHASKPWIGVMGLRVESAARAAQHAAYGDWDPLDGPQDAYRHAVAAALFALRCMRDHGVAPTDARALAIEAGTAHETDGQDNNDTYSRAMDIANNRTGTLLLGDGGAIPGEEADAAGFVTEAALRVRILRALGAGHLRVVDRSGDKPVERSTLPSDLPRRKP